MTSYIPLAFLLLAACTIFETKQDKDGCHRLITDSHMKSLSDLVNSQMKTTCRHSFCYVDKKELSCDGPILVHYCKKEHISGLQIDYLNRNNIECFLKAAYMPLLNILNQIEFKNNTPNFDKLKVLKELHLHFGICLDDYHDEFCTKRFLLTAEEMLLVVQDYFSEAKRFLFEGNFTQDCSSIFEKCSSCQEKEEKEFSGVATDQDCPCLAPSPNSGGGLASLLPASEPSSSIADQLDSKETADGIQQLFVLPDTTQIQGVAEHSTRSRVLRSTQMVSQATGSMDFRAGADMVMFLPAEEQPLAAVSQKSDLGPMNAFSFLDPGITLDRSSHQHKNILPSISGQSHIASLETKSPLTDSGAGSSLTWPNNHVVDSKDPIFATRQPLRLVATTNSPSFLLPISPESGSWGEEGSRGRSHGGQQSTQLRERRAERDEGLAQDWEPVESMLGPGFDLSFIPSNTDRHAKKPEPSETRGTAVIYVAVPSVLGILLAVGGLLFYLHKSRLLARRQLQRNESNMERPEEGRPLNKGEECVELQIQETL